MSEVTPTKPNQCAATRKDGQPCRAQVLESGYCFAHDPARKEQRDAARSAGGHNRANIVRLRGLVPPRLTSVYDSLEAALGEVHSGDLEPGRAQAMASLARAMVHVLTAGEMEERMRKLEETAERNDRSWS